MEVSRVNMITPKQIDWRKLTAKDIIKYDAEGLEIPSQYLQWARAFRVDLEKNDTDNTTYEMAVAKSNQAPKTKKLSQTFKRTINSPKNQKTSEDNVKDKDTKKEVTQTVTQEQDANGKVKSTSVQTNSVTEKTADSDHPVDTANMNKPVEEMTAEEKIQYMRTVEEKSDRAILKTLRSDSKDKADLSKAGSNTVNNLSEESSSVNESIESFMQDILAQAQELETKIQGAKGNKKSDIANVLSMKAQLEKLGIQAQSALLDYEGVYDSYGATIEEFGDVGSSSVDFGDQTIKLAEEFIRIGRHNPFEIRSYILGKSAKSAGKDAVEEGSNLIDAKNLAVNNNDSNHGNLNSYQAQVAGVTGVSVADVQKEQGANSEGQNPEANKQQNAKDQAQAQAQPAQLVAGAKTGDSAKVDSQKPEKGEPNPIVEEAKVQERIALNEKREEQRENTNESDDKKTEVEKKEEKVASGSLDEILKRKIRKGEEV